MIFPEVIQIAASVVGVVAQAPKEPEMAAAIDPG